MIVALDRYAVRLENDSGVCPNRTDGIELESIPPRLRRGLGWHQRAALEAFATLTDPEERSTVSVVHGSVFAELATARALAASDEPTPARFTLSVHSAFTGVLSLAYGNHEGHLTLSAFGDTLAMCLVEAYGRLRDGAERVIVIVADEADEILRPDESAYCLGLRLRRSTERDSTEIEIAFGADCLEPARSSRQTVEAVLSALRGPETAVTIPPSRTGHPALVLRMRGGR